MEQRQLAESQWQLDTNQKQLCIDQKSSLQDIHLLSYIDTSHILKFRIVKRSLQCQIIKILFEEPLKWKALISIDLYNSAVSDQQIKLINHVLLRQLQVINLSDNKIGNKGAKHLSKILGGNVRQLNLKHSSLEDEALCHLSKTQFYNLQLIDLSYNNFTVRGFKYLTKSNWSKLKYILLNNSEIGEDFLDNIEIQSVNYRQSFKHTQMVMLNAPSIKSIVLFKKFYKGNDKVYFSAHKNLQHLEYYSHLFRDF